MLQQTLCVPPTTQFPIIPAILWRMAPAVVTRALMATARIPMKMVGLGAFLLMSNCKLIVLHLGYENEAVTELYSM